MKDLKYLFALTIPLSAFIGLYVKGGWLFLTPVYAFVFIPIIEHLMPVSSKNLSEETKEKLMKAWGPLRLLAKYCLAGPESLASTELH